MAVKRATTPKELRLGSEILGDAKNQATRQVRRNI